MTAPDAERLERLLGEYIDRLNAGERLDRDAILADHPDLGPDLLREIETFEGFTLPDGALSGAEAQALGTLGDYTLRRQIGRGGMGVVYEAWEHSMDRRVALKVLPAGAAADDRAFHRFMREARTAGKLSHPNVVAVFGVGLKERTPYYAMEFVEGETLAQLLARARAHTGDEIETPFGRRVEGPAYFGKMAGAFADVADGLQHAHAKGIVHRDIKPSNLILDRDGRLRILDFGLARLEGQESLTSSGDLVGTLLYMSPEQAKRRKVAVDHRTDIYSLGATLYETLTGRPPFQGKDHGETLSQIIERDPTEPRKIDARVPRDLETIVLKCLRKEPADRYGTAEALSQDLRRFARGDPIEARPQARLERLARRAWRQRWRFFAAALVLFSLAVGALLVNDRRVEVERRQEALYQRRVLAALTKLQLASMSKRAENRDAINIGPCNLFALEKPLTLPGGGRQGFIDSALEGFQAIATEFPERPEASYHLARGLLLLGRKELGLQVLEKAIASHPRFAPLQMLRMLFRESLGPEPTAVPDARPPRLDSANWEETYRYGYQAVVARRWRDAVAAYTRLIEINKESGERYLGLSLDVLLARGQAFLELEDYPSAIDDFTAAATLWPDLVEPIILKGKAHYLNGNRAFAEKAFDDAYRKAAKPDEVAQTIVIVYATSLQDHDAELSWACRIRDEAARETVKAGSLCALSRWSEAECAGRRAVELAPGRSLSLNNLGWALLGQARLDEAAGLFRSAIDIDPGDPLGYSRLGLTFKMDGKHGEAVPLYSKAVDLEQEFAAARIALAIELYTVGRLDRARAEAEKAIYLAPRAADARGALGWILAAMGRFEESEEQFRESTRLDPDCGPTYAYWGWSLESQGKSAEAIEMYRQSSRADRTGVLALNHFWLAGALEKEGLLEEAFTERCRAIAINPNIPEFHQGCLSLFRRLKRPQDVSAQLEILREPLQHLIEGGQVRPGILETLALAWMHGGKADIPRAAAFLERVLAMVGRGSPDALSVLAEARWLSGERAEAVRTLEEAMRVPGAKRFMRDQVEEYRRQLRPDLVSYVSIDAAPEPFERLLDPFRSAAKGEDVPRRLAYLEGRTLMDAGRHREAAGKLKKVIQLDEKSPEPALRLAECLRAAGDATAAEHVLREAITRGAGSREIWELWAVVGLADLVRGPGALLEELPQAPAEGGAEGYAADLGWLLERLKAGEAIRIDCGGADHGSPNGAARGRDRFFMGGIGEVDQGESGEAADRDIDRSYRWFPEDDLRPASYRVPLPRGRYRVTLHFAEFWFHARGLRRFDVLANGQTVLQGYEPLQAGFKTPDARTFETEVEDGMLEIEFLPQVGSPVVSAIEIERGKD